MTEMDNDFDMARFMVNEHGRILSGNHRFCRMFGYSEEEIGWHYITDFFRYPKEWESFRSCEDLTRFHFVVRMKNRKGRSFKCDVTREIQQDEEGRVSFCSYVKRIGDKENSKSIDLESRENGNKALVFIVKCAQCENRVRVSSIADTHKRVLCESCAMKACPEAYLLKSV